MLEQRDVAVNSLKLVFILVSLSRERTAPIPVSLKENGGMSSVVVDVNKKVGVASVPSSPNQRGMASVTVSPNEQSPQCVMHLKLRV